MSGLSWEEARVAVHGDLADLKGAKARHESKLVDLRTAMLEGFSELRQEIHDEIAKARKETSDEVSELNKVITLLNSTVAMQNVTLAKLQTRAALFGAATGTIVGILAAIGVALLGG